MREVGSGEVPGRHHGPSQRPHGLIDVGQGGADHKNGGGGGPAVGVGLIRVEGGGAIVNAVADAVAGGVVGGAADTVGAEQAWVVVDRVADQVRAGRGLGVFRGCVHAGVATGIAGVDRARVAVLAA